MAGPRGGALVLAGFVLGVAPGRGELGLERVHLCEGVALRPAADAAAGGSSRVPPGGQTVEVVMRQWTTMRVLLPDRREAWVDAGACMGAPPSPGTSAARVAALLAGARPRPHPELPGEVRTWELRDEGTRIEVVAARLGRPDRVRPGIWIAPAYDAVQPGTERLRRLEDSPRARRALAAINGTFFRVRRGLLGYPLGEVVAGGRTRHLPDDESLAARRRTFLCWTSLRGLELTESRPRTAEVLLGGLGRLALGGDPEAWRAHVGLQFGASFYSSEARRARSLVGVAERGRRIFLLAQADSPQVKRPLSLPELTHLMVGLGAREVAFLDGGESTQLLFGGAPRVVGRARGRARPVSTALLLEAR